MQPAQLQPIVQGIIENMERVIRGKREQLQLVLCAWFAGGHVLIEDVPGTGKTMLARALARSVDVPFRRIQFTPDLLPADVLGSTVFRQQDSQAVFHGGPIFTTLLLADEINRATPRSQAALLEAMAESQVTADGRSYALDPLFFVLATQNPVEHHGTFPLPEAQLDRFMLRMSLGYPAREDEILVVKDQNQAHPIHSLKPVVKAEHVRAIRERVPLVKVSDEVLKYAMDVVGRTRAHPDLRLGASPRATLALIHAAQAMALVQGKAYVSPSQIYQLASPTLAHRLIPTAEARLRGQTAEEILTRILTEIEVPTGSA